MPFDPANSNTQVTFSNNDYTVTQTPVFNSGIIRALSGVATGKYMYSVNIDAMTGTGSVMAVGIVEAGRGSVTGYLGSQVSGYGYWNYGQLWNSNSPEVTGMPIYTQGNKVDIAVDLDALKIWVGVDGVWTNSGDPAAGTNETYTLLAGTYYPAGSFYATTPSQMTLIDPGAALPAGFDAWPDTFQTGLAQLSGSGTVTITSGGDPTFANRVAVFCIVDNTGTPYANQTFNNVIVLDDEPNGTPTVLETFTNVTTDGSGNVTLLFTTSPAFGINVTVILDTYTAFGTPFDGAQVVIDVTED